MRITKTESFEALRALCDLMGRSAVHGHVPLAEELGIGAPDLCGDLSAHDFAIRYAVANYLKKYQGSRPGSLGAQDRMRKAFDLWTEIEEHCKNVNNSFRFEADKIESATRGILSGAQRKIAKVLGVLTPALKSRILEVPEVTGGATYASKRGCHPEQKLSYLSTATSSVRHLAKMMVDSNPHWVWIEPTIVRGSRISFVPKTFQIDRTINIEPSWNMLFQRSVGVYMRERLKRYGVDLSNQTTNQNLAEAGERLGLATIDLSSASDSISIGLVRSLLPDDWFVFLNTLRSHEVETQKGWRRLQKFASMGNGFCFELETLIFWAIAETVSENHGCAPWYLAVYGDDIIVPSCCAQDVIDVLGAVGFACNREKTFVSGPFRESCGAHYFKGCLVTPPYQKEEICDLPSLIRAHNRLQRWLLRVGLNDVHTPVSRLLHKWRKDLPEMWVSLDTESDSAFICASGAQGPWVVHCFPRSRSRFGDDARCYAYTLARMSHQKGGLAGEDGKVSQTQVVGFQLDAQPAVAYTIPSGRRAFRTKLEKLREVWCVEHRRNVVRRPTR